MTQKYEQMSAFMDGESSASSVADSITQESDLSDAWGRYHLIKSTLRNELPQDALVDISASVAAAIEAEPAILAPSSASSNSIFAKLSSRVIPFVKQSGQYAVAASVAAAVIIGVQTYNQPESNEPYPTLQTGAPLGVPAPVSLGSTRVVPAQEDRAVVAERRQVQALLQDHERQMRLKVVKSQTGQDAEQHADKSVPEDQATK